MYVTFSIHSTRNSRPHVRKLHPDCPLSELGSHLLELPEPRPARLTPFAHPSHRIDVRTRLKRAILTDDLLVVKRLVTENPACMSFCDEEEQGNTPLHIAAEHGMYSIMVFLCMSGHEADGISRNYEGQTPLMVAAASVSSVADDVVFYLASEYERCIDWRDKAGMTALMLAAKAGNDANVNILLDSDADINAFEPQGNTPLHFASAYGHLKVIRTLIDRGANFEHRNRKGWSAKDYSFSIAAEQYFKTLIDGVAIKHMTINMGGASSSIGTSGGGGGGSGSSAPSSRDGSSIRRPGTAGSFSYGSSTAASTTSTLVPHLTGNSVLGGLPPFGAGGGMNININIPTTVASLISPVASGPGTPVDDLAPPQRVLKSAASMVEFSRMDRGSISGGGGGARPGTPVGMGGSSSGADVTSSPAGAPMPMPGRSGRHSATGSVSSYASGSAVGSFGSAHGVATGFGLPLMLPSQQQQQQQGQGHGHSRSIYDPFTKLRPRASSNS
ncbi:hypothetical protein DRE_02883 [Drechslerella stenobrocha 248]|uniref:Uncharacterized protein n=1 Tax=Drechslerella stenobrocha 248 TaxID=1043628 RepID=W7HUZ3_9PEZI|nr:hypothetical protein DRE_02883 [Drechslerella stenobrocha 248]